MPTSPLCAPGDFPLLAQHPQLVYWDSAATSQKPRVLLDALTHFYGQRNAPVHRAAYPLGYQLSQDYEQVRHRFAAFCRWPLADEVVFTHGCTEAINLVAQQFLSPRLQAGERVLVSVADHHANFIPWQRVCRQRGAKLVLLPVDGRGELPLEELEAQLKEGCAMLALPHVSNVLGTINPIADIARLARHYGTPLLVDGAQACAHLPLDLSAVDCDFYCCSTHKMYAADGCGVLLAKSRHLRQMAPLLVGGGIVEQVSAERTVYLPPPQRFEAGTMPASAIVTLPVVLDYLEAMGMERVASYEDGLRRQCEDLLQQQPGLTIYGQACEKAAVISFAVDGAHPHDIATVFSQHGLAIRAGHHCAQPLMNALGVSALARISLAVYNEERELSRLAAALHTLRKVLL